MNVVRFQARDAADAVGQIREQLGAQAVVLSVERIPAAGLGRWWRKPYLEVVAGLPDSAGTFEQALTTASHSAVAEQGREAAPEPMAKPPPVPPPQALEPAAANPEPARAIGAPPRWRSVTVLEQLGLLPVQAEKVLERVRSEHGEQPPASLAHEMEVVRSGLESFWRPATRSRQAVSPIHVFVGPAGSGKTTALCKWLAKSVLAEGRKARAWRLDTGAANFAGLLDLYGEILGVPIEREWQARAIPSDFEVGFVDLPGICPNDTAAIAQLWRRLDSIPRAQVHLVLNASYDTTLLLAQARSFAPLPLTDLIFTHLDEEKRSGKLWNLILDTNLPIRYLSGGQNIPGEFALATPDRLCAR